MYKPIQPIRMNKLKTASLGGKRGINKRDLPQMLTPEHALEIKNYLLNSEGGMEKRKGLIVAAQVALANYGATMIEPFTGDLVIFAYNTTVAAWRRSTNAITTIKSDFTTSDAFTGKKFGDYFITGNGGNRTGRISQTLAFKTQTVNFIKNSKITGATSGATAIIVEQVDGGATGTLTLGSISGTFQDGEIITGETAGSATVNGTLTFVFTEITTAPYAKIINVLGARCQGGNLKDDPSAIIYSPTHTGANPPFNDWTLKLAYDGQTGNYAVGEIVTGQKSGATGVIVEDTDLGAAGILKLKDIKGIFEDDEALTGSIAGVAVVNGTLSNLATDMGRIAYPNAGAVTNILPYGQYVVVGAESGEWAFYVTTIDSQGVLVKYDETVWSQLDKGMARGAIATDQGIFYANESGINRLLSVGQSNVPLSSQVQFTTDLLGAKYFDDIDLSNADMTHISKYSTVLLTCGKGAATNNYVIALNYGMKNALSYFVGWKINRFLNIDDVLYGVDSRTTTIYKLFENSDDNGAPISTEIYQEMNVKAWESMGELYGGRASARLHPNETMRIAFDIYDRENVFKKDKLVINWTPSRGLTEDNGYDQQAYGSPFGGSGVNTTDTVECESGFPHTAKIANFGRLLMRITTASKYPHTFNWISLMTREKGAKQYRNEMTKSS